MAKKSDLRLAWVDAATARKAVEAWHYSKSYPMPPVTNVGVWEADRFIGVVVFGHGGNFRSGDPYGMRVGEVVELVRVAMRPHSCQVSRCIRIALLMLKKSSPGVRLVVSYADPVQGHGGGIYKAGGWVFAGQTSPSFEYRAGGKRLQKRAFTGANFGNGKMKLPPGAVKVQVPGKLKFLMPMDDEARALISQLARPYLKGPSSITDASPVQGEDGSSGLTGGLQTLEVDDGPAE